MPDALAPDPFTSMAAQLTPKRAVSYIRVSTREQAQRGGSEEGFSLPAQREANKRKAQSMGALVVKEFADRGESARSANRPELQKMLAYLKEDGGIDYVIVHKLDRLARNRADDVEINRAFEDAGVRLVSTSENIDQTPGGMLLHGIMSSIAEFYSRNLANEVMKGMGEKARNGGTLGKAPLGYMNVRGRDENGREVRTIALDEERAPLIRLAFTAYATGNWTVRQLADHLNTLGLNIPPTPRRCAKPITATRLHEILRHPYYKGIVTFQGVEYPGKHEPLVDSQTWQTVQTILASRRYGERQRIHNHFLKSTVVCGQCGARLSVQNAKNSKGTIYPYFVCARRCRLHDCTFTAVLIDVVEDRMSDLYRAIELSAEDRTQIEHYLHDELAQIEGDKAKAVRSLTTRRTNIEDRRRRLLHAHYEGAVPLDLLKEEQAELSTELNQIERQLAAYQADAAEVRQHLTQALDLLEDCHRLYSAAPAHLKKLLNQVFFQRVLVNPLVDEDGRVISPSTGDGTTDGGKQPGKDADAHDGQHSDSAGEREGTSDASGGGAADADTPAVTSHPIHLADTGSGTCLSALLTPPFDQLASPSLHAAAHAHHLQHAAQPDSSTTPPTADDTPMSSTTRTTPTLVGERCSTSGTASQAVSTGVGSGKSLLVQLRTIDPNNLMVLLDFRRKLAAGEGGQVCTGPNVAHLPATDGSDGALGDADEPMPSHGADSAGPEGESLQRRCTAPATNVGERPNGESDAPDTASRSPRVVDRIKQTKFRPLTPEQRQQVIDLYRAGVPVKEIVRQTGVNRSTVYRLRGQTGLERSHRFTDDDRAQAILLRQQGLTIAEIAKQLGFSGMTIGRHLAAAREE